MADVAHQEEEERNLIIDAEEVEAPAETTTSTAPEGANADEEGHDEVG